MYFKSSIIVVLIALTSLGLVSCRSYRNQNRNVARRISNDHHSNLNPQQTSYNLTVERKSSGQELTGLKALPRDCGQYVKHQRISGGRPANEGEFPSYVYVSFDEFDRNYCGGTIISDRHILTAAHCTDLVFQRYYAGRPRVVTGYKQPTAKGKKDYKSAKVCMSDQFRGSQVRVRHDVAVIKLAEPIQFSRTVQPACLPMRDFTNEENRKFFAIGFGKTSDVQIVPEILQVLPFKPITCLNLDQDETTTCFKARGPDLIGDTCAGDSGGGILTVEDNKHTVVALTSYGPDSCQAGKEGYAVNANVHYLLDEIDMLLKECA